ncbi:prolyl oligopeptidase family serine peptidase [Roseateles depolymerans]|uniref:Serine protease, S9A family peptidase n=1 Tax=Roseateles depolymerans TaxID=76731 RepID=A0A0U3MUJ3_9BURK|nr:prolyl oligopeptidase family serine peptidase [Roseateles depolymerans]ALV08026.1 Serine protease, S9A family peptidase [Roseateles depolymerans]REG21754.1 prolyl oligopeptidase [Roseateles depolymerans]
MTDPNSTMTATTDPAAGPGDTSPPDEFLWLEALDGEDGERALDWVRARNAESQSVLQARADYEPIRQELLQLLNAQDRIPHVARRGDWFYNLWQDEAHPRGLWRRCRIEDYAQPEPPWVTVLDLDALGQAEQRSWVFHGAIALAPDYRRCLVSLSDGGADAAELREFDLETLRFIPVEDGGFFVPEAKSDVEWLDENTLLVGTDLGPGSLTDSGYPRQVRQWVRGTPLAQAPVVFEGEASDVSVGASVDRTPGYERVFFSRSLDFYNEARFLWRDGQRVPIDLPSDMSVHAHGPWWLLRPRSDWTVAGHTHPAGSLLLLDDEAFWRGERQPRILFVPTPGRSLDDYALTHHHVLLTLSEHVASRLEEWDLSAHPPVLRTVQAPFPGTLSVQTLHDPELPQDRFGDDYLLHYCDFLTPDTVSLAHAGRDDRTPLKQRGAQFDAAGMSVQQFFARSADGENVPYFVIGGPGQGADTPTLLYGYGGFEVSLQPWYSGTNGRAWLTRGGRLVVANIRGGGEYGPQWHQAATGAHKQRSFDDFIAVAEDLIRRGLTRPERLGIMGGSNGGLLVGACMVQRPELFGAVVCQVPLLDMRRYHLLLAGASWMAEYGDPDDAQDWAHLSRYSPYQNLKPGVRYPRALFATSTRDDRVHPGHARKMAARLLSLGQACDYYENIEGGHGGAADNQQRAQLQALEFSYLWQQLGDPKDRQ